MATKPIIPGQYVAAGGVIAAVPDTQEDVVDHTSDKLGDAGTQPDIDVLEGPIGEQGAGELPAAAGPEGFTAFNSWLDLLNIEAGEKRILERFLLGNLPLIVPGQLRRYDRYFTSSDISPYCGMTYNCVSDLPPADRLEQNQKIYGDHLFDYARFATAETLIEALKRGVNLARSSAVLHGANFTDLSDADRAYIRENSHRLPRDFSSTIMDAALLADLAAGGIRKFQSAEIRGGPNHVITNLHLNEIDFTGASIMGVEFNNVNLADADFTGARLLNVRFINTDMSRAEFVGKSLDAEPHTVYWLNVGFRDVNLSGATLDVATIISLYMHNVEMTGAKLSVPFLLALPLSLRLTGLLSADGAKIVPGKSDEIIIANDSKISDLLARYGSGDPVIVQLAQNLRPYFTGEAPLTDLLKLMAQGAKIDLERTINYPMSYPEILNIRLKYKK